MNCIKIETPELMEAFEKINDDVQAQLKVIERQHRRRKIVMYCSLAAAIICLIVAVIKCLN